MFDIENAEYRMQETEFRIKAHTALRTTELKNVYEINQLVPMLCLGMHCFRGSASNYEFY